MRIGTFKKGMNASFVLHLPVTHLKSSLTIEACVSSVRACRMPAMQQTTRKCAHFSVFSFLDIIMSTTTFVNLQLTLQVQLKPLLE